MPDEANPKLIVNPDCPNLSPLRGSKRLPGGLCKSSKFSAASNTNNFRKAEASKLVGIFLVSSRLKSLSVSRHLKDLITL